MTDAWQYRLGLMLIVASAVAWSTAGLFTRMIGLDAWTMLLWRGLFGALGIFVFICVQQRQKTLRAFRAMGSSGWLFAIVSAIGMLCFITSLNLTSVAHVAIIYATAPFVAAAIAWFVLREQVSASAGAASLAALAGVVVIVGAGGDGTLVGDLLAFAMTFSMAVMMVISRRNRDIPMLAAACLSALLSAAAALPMASFTIPSGFTLINLALFGLVNSALGLALFTLGARLLPPAETALIGALDAPLAPVWVLLAFGETPSRATLLGGAIVFVAVAAHLIHGFAAGNRQPQHETA